MTNEEYMKEIRSLKTKLSLYERDIKDLEAEIEALNQERKADKLEIRNLKRLLEEASSEIREGQTGNRRNFEDKIKSGSKEVIKEKTNSDFYLMMSWLTYVVMIIMGISAVGLLFANPFAGIVTGIAAFALKFFSEFLYYYQPS